MSSTLLNESTFGYNRLHTARRPHPEVPSTQDFGIRLPYYPNIPSVSEIRAQGYFNFGDNLEASFPRDSFQFNNKTNWIKGTSRNSSSASSSSTSGLRSTTITAGPDTSSRTANSRVRRVRQVAAMRSPTSCLAGSARSITERASTRTIEISIRRISSRTTSNSAIA